MHIPKSRECPVCNLYMRHTDDDSRQEWCESNYYCLTCDVIFTWRINFEIQSYTVADEGWLQVPDKEPFFNIGQKVFYNEKTPSGLSTSCVNQIHIDQNTFEYHYHVFNYPQSVAFSEADISKDAEEALLLNAMYATILDIFEPAQQEVL